MPRDKIKKAIADQRYGQSEKGFVGNKWVHLSKPSARRRHKNGREITISLTKQTYWLEYLNHKQIMKDKYPKSDGKLCRYCEKPFTFKEALINPGNKKAKRKKKRFKQICLLIDSIIRRVMKRGMLFSVALDVTTGRIKYLFKIVRTY